MQSNMDDKTKQSFADYEEIKLQIKALEDKLEPIKEVVLTYFAANKDKKIETNSGGCFSYKEKTTWKYPVEVETERARVKELEKASVATGTATKAITGFFEYRVPKKDTEDDLI
jgi:hypothetical protein